MAKSPDAGARPYSWVSIVLHWLTLGLLVAVYAVILLREEYPRGSEIREALKAWHFSLGLTGFLIVWIRLIARLIHPARRLARGWMARASAATHLALYGFMIAMPLLGWTALSAEGDPVRLFGLGLPPLTAPDPALAERVEGVHEALGTVGYFLVGLHAAAALFHHHVLRDDTLRRMIFRPSSGGASTAAP